MSASDVDTADLEAAHAGRPPRRSAQRRAAARGNGWVWVLAVLVVAAAGWGLVLSEGRGEASLWSAENWGQAGRFVADLLGVGVDATPAFRRAGVWAGTFWLTVETLAMSVLAAGLSGAAALATVAFASRTLTYGELAVAGPVAGRLVFAATRAAHILARAVPELLWVLLLVLVVRSHFLAAVLALALHNFGVLGRLGSDVVEDCDPEPLRSLRSSGAGNLQVLFYGVLPQVLPQYVTFLLYRWEVLTRATVVVGLVATAGLGHELRLNMSSFHYTHVATILAAYVVLVWAVDLASAGMRRLAR